ncbi:alpha/beta hydrolase [Sciscionella marina]|uniref:alpha/beta hydrolase n=1 Tax=Sciscionella marina TaxID=508770 RepID=UPI0003788A60|nr:alpha/beta hydrolase [Sciscionella marina]
MRKRKRPARHLSALFCCALTAVLVLTACSAGQQGGSERGPVKSPGAGAPAGTNGATPPALDWRPCGGGFRCAEAAVPLDYRAPHGKRITLPLVMQPAEDRSHVTGPLFINYGGPGTPGAGMLRKQGPKYPEQLRRHFDLIAFDPRGTGPNTPHCAPGAQAPQGPPGSGRFWATAASTGHACAKDPLLDHASSANTARDMDLIRQAARAEQISYLGYSYGTYLGAVYANMFPSHVRAMTFDGTLDLVANSTGRPGTRDEPVDVRAGVADAQRAQLDQFLAACAKAAGACPFAAGGDPKRKWAELVATLGRDGQGAGLFERIFSDLETGAPMWTYLAKMLERTYRSVRPGETDEQHTAPVRDPYVPSHSTGFLAVQCVDSDIPQRKSRYPELARRAAAHDPAFGASAVYDMAQCVGWPGKDEDRYQGPWNAHLAAPVLIINNRYDPATPLPNAESTAGELARARVLVIDGAGHTSLNVHSACASNAMAAYFTGLKPSPTGTTCPPDYRPFS